MIELAKIKFNELEAKKDKNESKLKLFCYKRRGRCKI